MFPGSFGMRKGIILIFLVLFGWGTAICQTHPALTLINTKAACIDSIADNGKNIAHYIRVLYADDGGKPWLKHHYIVDSIKQILYKCIYEEIGHEKVIFYYDNKQPIKAILTDSSSKPVGPEHYFSKGIAIKNESVTEISPNSSWSSKELLAQANQYLLEFSGICDMLNKRK